MVKHFSKISNKAAVNGGVQVPGYNPVLPREFYAGSYAVTSPLLSSFHVPRIFIATSGSASSSEIAAMALHIRIASPRGF